MELQLEPVKEIPLAETTVSKTKLAVTNTEKYFSFPMSNKHLSDAPCSSSPCIYDLHSLKSKLLTNAKGGAEGEPATGDGEKAILIPASVDNPVVSNTCLAGGTSNADDNLLKRQCDLQNAASRNQQAYQSDGISLTSYSGCKEFDSKPNMILRKRISATVHPAKGRMVTTAFTDRLSPQQIDVDRSTRPSLRKQLSYDRNYDAIENNLSSNNSSLNSLPPSPGRFKQPMSDLDIQLANADPAGFDLKTPEEPNDAKRFNHYAKRRGRKDLISNTVDMWAHQSSLDESSSMKSLSESLYKPLIFGGTFPIDGPASPPEQPRKSEQFYKEDTSTGENSVSSSMDSLNHKKLLRKTIERSLDNFEKALAKKHSEMESTKKKHFSNKNIVKTFDIDEPVLFEDIRKSVVNDAKARRPNKDHNVTRTFAIDEPI